MKGILHGVSVGAGDPQLMTLKAKKLIDTCAVIAAPRTRGENTLALDIAKGVCDMSGKDIVYLDFAMSTDTAVLGKTHKLAAEKLILYLSDGKDVALLSLGDISIYSTFSYIAEYIAASGFEYDICAGVPSFCAAAAELKKPLVSGNETLAVFPACSESFDSLMRLNGTKVIMKSAGQVEKIIEAAGGAEIIAVENCGLENERIAPITDGGFGYFTTIIIR